MLLRRSLLILIVVVGLISGLQSRLHAQTAVTITAPSMIDRHAWAQFDIGSWKQVRVYTESLDDKGQVESVSITETKTTLDKADERSYTLKIEVTVEVAGKRFQAAPKYVAYGYHGELQGQAVDVDSIGTGHTTICGSRYSIVRRRIVIRGTSTQSTSTVEYSNTIAPYFLKRTTESIDLKTKERNYQSLVEVIAVDMPEKVLTEFKSASHVKTIETYGNGITKITLEVHCESVPGGVVSHTSRQMGTDKRTTQRSTLSLVDYKAIKRAPLAKDSATGRRRRSRRRN